MQQEVVLGLLAKEPSHGYELRARIEGALGPLASSYNGGQMYVTLSRLEQSGLVTSAPGPAGERDRKVYELTPAGRDRLTVWLADVGWARPDLTDFHLKLVVAATAHLTDPLALVAAQRRELLRRLAEAQRSLLAEAPGSDAALVLEGVVLRIEADLAWLDACERVWAVRS